MKADPPVRADGRCALASCRKPRKMPRPQKGVDPAAYALDPFCSSTCARAWHGVSVTQRDETRQGRPRVYESAAA